MASLKNSGVFWVVTRFTTHESRGTTHWIASGSVPELINHTHASIAVLPAPITTKRRAKPVPCELYQRPGSAFGGTRRTPSPTVKRGVCMAGTDGLK